MLLLSIRPEFVEKIFAGEKRVELRRRRPRLQSGETDCHLRDGAPLRVGGPSACCRHPPKHPPRPVGVRPK